ARVDGRFGAHEGAEAAVCARDYVLAAHDLCVADNALRDKLRVLDKIGRGVNHTRNDDQPIREVKLLEDDPLMFVSWVCTLKGESADFGLYRHVDDFRERDIQVVWAFVVAPAHVQPHSISRNVPQGVIKGRHVKVSDLLELLCAQVGKPVVPAHAQVGAIHLKHETGTVDGVVFLFQGVRQGV